MGLDKAYNLDSGSYVFGDTLFVAGTKSLRDVWDDLKIPFGLTSWSDRYQQADRVLQASPQVRRVVGHSLGGAVALELAKTIQDSRGRRRTELQCSRSRAATRGTRAGWIPWR